MENASKALLIAAAILIVIVLIAISMAVVNSSANTQQQAEDLGESTSMQAFNAQFAGYIGTNRTPTSVRNLLILLSKVSATDKTHAIEKTGPSFEEVVDNRTYNVTAGYNSDTGHINRIVIE